MSPGSLIASAGGLTVPASSNPSLKGNIEDVEGGLSPGGLSLCNQRWLDEEEEEEEEEQESISWLRG